MKTSISPCQSQADNITPSRGQQYLLCEHPQLLQALQGWSLWVAIAEDNRSGCPQNKVCLKSLVFFVMLSVCSQVCPRAAALSQPWWHQKATNMQVLSVLLQENFHMSWQPFTQLEALKVILWFWFYLVCACDTEGKGKPSKNSSCILHAVFIL